MSVKSVLRNAQKKLVPSAKERKRMEEIVARVREITEAAMIKNGYTFEFFLGGSVAKGTWISGSKEVDVFLRVPKEYDDISKACGEVLRSCFKKVRLVHGSRDYFQVGFKGYTFEFVPVLLIPSVSKMENMTDASPFHVEFVNKRLSPEQKKEVVLLKAFCKAANVYGAESYKSGFSGYVLELLVAKYGSFEDLAFAAERLKPKVFIDLKRVYKDFKSAMKRMGEHKTKSPILLVDPVLLERNAAASLSYSSFSRFVFAIRSFVSGPDISFFEESITSRKSTRLRAKRRGTKCYSFRLDIPKDENMDIFMAKIAKKLGMMKSRFEKEGFCVFEKGAFFENGRVCCFFEFETHSVSGSRRHVGPPVWVREKDFDKFMKKWARNRKKSFGPYVFGTNLVVDVARPYKNLKELFYMVKEEFFSEVKKPGEEKQL